MAAGEDQTEAIVFNLFIVQRSVGDARLHMGNKVSLHSIEARPSAHAVNRFESCRRNEPGARLVWNAGLRP